MSSGCGRRRGSSASAVLTKIEGPIQYDAAIDATVAK